MHFQFLLLGSLLACACSKYVPSKAELASYLRSRRNALSHSTLHTHDEQNRHYKNTLFDIEEDNLNDYGGDSYSYVPEEPANKKTVVSKYEQTAEASNVSPSSIPYSNINNFNSYTPVNTAKPELNRHIQESDFNGKKKNKKASAAVQDGGEKFVAKRYSPGQSIYEEEEHYPPPKYDFKYTVHDVEHHDIKHHQEERDGDNTVGEYSVLQPDGTILTVKYTVHGDEGFNAIVSKSELPHEYEHY